MEMKKESNILTEEKPKYIISLKKRYRILYIVMFALFMVCTMYFGVISLCAGTDTMIFGIGITVIFLIFLFYSLYGLTRKCERYKGKVVYSFFLTKREYKLSDIAFSNEKIEEFYKDYGDGNVSSSWDKVTIFYNKQGEKLFKFGLAYDNVQLFSKRCQKYTEKYFESEKGEVDNFPFIGKSQRTKNRCLAIW